MSRKIYGKSTNFKNWHDEYTNKSRISLIQYFTPKDITILKKIGINISDKLYTEKEFDMINDILLDYCATNSKNEVVLSAFLKNKKISKEDYENILNIFYKIAEDYCL